MKDQMKQKFKEKLMIEYPGYVDEELFEAYWNGRGFQKNFAEFEKAWNEGRFHDCVTLFEHEGLWEL